MTAMPLWKWKHRGATGMLSRSKKLRTELLLAVAELDVFTAALACEIERPDDEGAWDDHQRGPTD
jgi:uncharacterized small protein (DUF1192 family)